MTYLVDSKLDLVKLDNSKTPLVDKGGPIDIFGRVGRLLGRLLYFLLIGRLLDRVGRLLMIFGRVGRLLMIFGRVGRLYDPCGQIGGPRSLFGRVDRLLGRVGRLLMIFGRVGRLL